MSGARCAVQSLSRGSIPRINCWSPFFFQIEIKKEMSGKASTSNAWPVGRVAPRKRKRSPSPVEGPSVDSRPGESLDLFPSRPFRREPLPENDSETNSFSDSDASSSKESSNLSGNSDSEEDPPTGGMESPESFTSTGTGILRGEYESAETSTDLYTSAETEGWDLDEEHQESGWTDDRGEASQDSLPPYSEEEDDRSIVRGLAVVGDLPASPDVIWMGNFGLRETGLLRTPANAVPLDEGHVHPYHPPRRTGWDPYIDQQHTRFL